MQSVSVLVIEDETLIRMELEEAVREGGYTPISVVTGEDALAELDTSDDIRAILTDVSLGKGMTGWELARRARERHPEMPVVYVSSVSHDAWSAHGVTYSIPIQKPFAPAQVITAISQLLNAAESDSAD